MIFLNESVLSVCLLHRQHVVDSFVPLAGLFWTRLDRSETTVGKQDWSNLSGIVAACCHTHGITWRF